ncbi:WhiB family transcriptional regulator [Rhodococcus sp. IEGM 248]|nr:WhiB family transcriptional regulator [Rhodococcus opacus]NDV06654.1 WhiB family transcriptional regulator [Rhodococcus sp. IEGM 248]
MASTRSQRLPEPLTINWDWQLDARCRQIDTDVFFPCDDEGRGARIRRERVAKQICELCPVQLACRTHALIHREPHGVWGGTNEIERRSLEPRSTNRTGPAQPLEIVARYRIPGRNHTADR